MTAAIGDRNLAHRCTTIAPKDPLAMTGINQENSVHFTSAAQLPDSIKYRILYPHDISSIDSLINVNDFNMLANKCELKSWCAATVLNENYALSRHWKEGSLGNIYTSQHTSTFHLLTMAIDKYILSLRNLPTSFTAPDNDNWIYDNSTYKKSILEHFEHDRKFPLRQATCNQCNYYSVRTSFRPRSLGRRPLLEDGQHHCKNSNSKASSGCNWSAAAYSFFELPVPLQRFIWYSYRQKKFKQDNSPLNWEADRTL
jgi:hypothetical protein